MYGLTFPPNEFEFEDLPYAESIRILVKEDQEWWDARRKKFEDFLIEDEKYRREINQQNREYIKRMKNA